MWSVFRLLLLLMLCAARAALAQAPDTLWATVDGHRLHLLYWHPARPAPGPLIVLETGAESTHAAWGEVPATLVARGYRVVTYDRPGFGASARCPHPRRATRIADELHAALAAHRLAPPYLLAGWSLGGGLVRVFAARYPRMVQGLVLVDPIIASFYPRATREQPALMAHYDTLDAPVLAGPPTGARDELQAWAAILRDVRAARGRWAGPVELLSSSRSDLGVLGPIWADEQERWAAATPQVVFTSVPAAGHAIQGEQPARVVDAIVRVARR